MVLSARRPRLVGLDLATLAEMQIARRAMACCPANGWNDRGGSILIRHFRTDSPAYASLVKLRSEIELRDDPSLAAAQTRVCADLVSRNALLRWIKKQLVIHAVRRELARERHTNQR